MKSTMQVFFLLLFFWGVPILSLAQNLTPKVIQSDSFIKRVSTNGNNLSVGQQIPTMPSASGVRINEVFLDEKWKNSSIALYGSEKLIEGFRVRYELRSNSLELKISNQIKVLDVRRVKTLIWLDSLTNAAHYFVNGKEYLVDKVPFTSLLEVLSEGKVSLYKQYTYWIKKPDFVPSLDVGSVDERIYKKDIFLVAQATS